MSSWWAIGCRRTRQCGQGLAEYAIVLMLISVVAIVVMAAIGGRVNTMYESAGNTLVAP